MNTRTILALSLFSVIAILAISIPANADERIELEYTSSSVANPLKGLVPYASDANVHFPHTLEFGYLSFADLMTGYDSFHWQPLETMLDSIARRGHQAVFRVYLEYPAKTGVIPKFLIADGLKVHKYTNTNTAPLPPAAVETPDYEDKNLRRALQGFIRALGMKYDGDPRIGFITAGLLGTWGEWHTYPRDELFASKAVQAEVMDAYQAAFKTTPILLRYPEGKDTSDKAANAHRPLGYHDDSFAWGTLDTGNKRDEWFYLPALRKAGPAAMEKWKSHPIGGEIRPEAWGKVFDKNPGDKRIQDFRQCVEQTHVSWLMDSGMFKRKPDEERKQRAENEVRRMGYEFHLPSVTISAKRDRVDVKLEVQNRGVAPFYYDWKATYGLIADGRLCKTIPTPRTLTGLLPGDVPRVWNDQLDLSDLPMGTYTLALLVPNSLPNGPPIRFANKTQDKDLDGWVSLATIECQHPGN